MIKMSVDLFNTNLEKENMLISLNTDYSMYNARPSKKSGKADLDLPSNIALI